MRPDPDTFNPLALINPEDVKAHQAFLDRVNGRDDEAGIAKTEPAAVAATTEPPPVIPMAQHSWWSPPRTILPAPTLFSRIVDLLGRIEGPREKALKAKKDQLRQGVVWGLWAGFHAGGADSEILEDWLAASAYASNPKGITFASWSEALLSADASKLTLFTPPADGARDDTPPRDPRLGPALAPQALFKSLLLRSWPRNEHIRQVLRATPWPAEGGTVSTLEQAAPALPGLFASAVFAELALFLSRGEWSVTGVGSAVDPARAWLETMVQEGGALAEGAGDLAYVARDKQVCARILQNHLIWQRHRPLRPPFSCVDLLHVALWANLDATSFDEVMGAVRSLGGDAVACAAAGALVGGRFGRDALPAAAMGRVPANTRVGEMAQRFATWSVEPF